VKNMLVIIFLKSLILIPVQKHVWILFETVFYKITSPRLSNKLCCKNFLSLNSIPKRIMKNRFEFLHLAEDDLPMLFEWLNRSHLIDQFISDEENLGKGIAL